jgi:hypothetical protein
MQTHVKNYFNSLGLDTSSYIGCEVCSSPAVDIHHIKERSKFGKKTKHIQDHPSNLIALCRSCHNKAHSSKEFNHSLIDIVLNRMS